MKDLLGSLQPGDKIRVTFKPGQGKKGTLSPEARNGLARFLALVMSGSFTYAGQEFVPGMRQMELSCVVSSGYWDAVTRVNDFQVQEAIHPEEVTFYADRFGFAIEKIEKI
jgi:hypothetical protein